MTTQIDPLTGSSPFKSIVAPLNSNDLLDAILYRSNSIADTSIESIISSKKQTNLNKSVALKSTDNQSKSSTQPVLLSNASNLSVNSLQSEPLTASATNIATIVTASATSPAPAAVVPSKLRIEAESITNRSVYRVENISAASGGQALSLVGGADQEVGSATFQFTGVSGFYDVVIGTFDENDGQARFDVTQNGGAIGSITLNQELGSGSANAQTAVARKVVSVKINNGDTFTIKGVENGITEHARLDYIDFIPAIAIVNTLPVANNDSATTNQNQAVTLLSSNLLANDTDADKDVLTLSSVKNAVNGSVVLNASGNPVFTPTTNFTGNASFDYVVSDGKGGTATAKVNVLVNAILPSKLRIEAETITNRSVYRVENISAASGGQALSLVGGADQEVGSATFQFTGVSGFYDVVIGTFDENDGQARFDVTQNGGAIGSITLNQELGSNSANAQTAVARKVVSVQIKNGDTFSIKGVENGITEHARLDYIDFIPAIPIVNTLPVANNDSATTNQNQAVTLLASNLLANDTDADKDVLTLSSVKNAVNGSVTLNASGNPVFTPTTNFTGNASFDYVVSDGKGGATSGTVSVLVNPVTVNRSPVANGDSATTKQNQAVTLLATNLLANDTDPDGDKLALSSVKSAVNGSVVLNASGNPVFTPTANFSGNSSFDYVISDGKGGTATATVKVLVTNPAIALPDLVTKFAPKSNPVLPTGKDIFAPSFVVNDAGNSSRPAIAEWTRTGKAGETIVLTGWQLDANTKFFVYGQTNDTNGVLLEAKIQKLDGNVAAITLPTTLPQGSDYLLWAQNSSGYSQPVMINQTETWWVKDTSSRGQIASVFGRNLSQDGGTQNSQVYLEDSAGKGYWAQVVGVNPYKVDFKVPDALANGDYQVFVHNGDGGQYGWSKPLTMTIDSGLNYTGAVFNVKNYGAKGDGVTNDTAAINAARAAADNTPWSTVYLPTGTYVVNDTLWTGKDQVRWLGDGKELTTIKAANGSSQGYLFQSDGVSQITFRDLTFDANANNGASLNKVTLITNSSDLEYLNVKILAEGSKGFDWNGNNGVSMKNSEITGQDNFLGNAQQVFIDNTDFWGTDYTTGLLIGRGTQMLSITNSIGQNLDTSDPNNGKWANGRFFVDQFPWGISQNHYLGNNQTIDMAVPNASGVDQNAGEQILWEQGDELSTFLGTVTSATSTSITVNAPSSTVNDQYYLSIVGGKGIGQSRQVQSLNQSTYTIYDNWNVQPDSSSVIVANRNVSNAVVYGNTLDGLSDYNTRQTASLGVETYFGSNNLIIDNNSFNQLGAGVVLMSGFVQTDNNPVNFTQVSNNAFTNIGSGVNIGTSGNKGTSSIGNSIHNNSFNNVGTALYMWPVNNGNGNPFPSANMNVFENNTLGVGEIYVNQGNGNIQNNIFLNNTSLNGPLNPGVVNGNFSF